MARRIIRFIVIILLISNISFAQEIITGFEKDDLVTLNEELRKLRSKINELNSSTSSAISNAIPSGVIVMWSGSVDDIPDGWVLCDGTNGTPDLTSKFIMGADDDTVSVGETGGSNTKDLSHTHSFSVSGMEIPIGMKSGGSPLYYDESDFTGSNKSFVAYNSRYNTTYENETSVSVPQLEASYSGTTGSGGGSSVDIRPAYYALAFIMKT